MISTLRFTAMKGLRVFAYTSQWRSLASLRDVLSEQIPKKREELKVLKKEYGYTSFCYDLMNISISTKSYYNSSSFDCFHLPLLWSLKLTYLHSTFEKKSVQQPSLSWGGYRGTGNWGGS